MHLAEDGKRVLALVVHNFPFFQVLKYFTISAVKKKLAAQINRRAGIDRRGYIRYDAEQGCLFFGFGLSGDLSGRLVPS